MDATFGRGGHSRALLARLTPGGRLIAFDRDPEAVAAAATIHDPRFAIRQVPFARLGEVLRAEGVEVVDGILLDLGVSSPQIDTPARGFSFRTDGPLDMRMDPSGGETVAEWLARATEVEISEVIRLYGEERYAKRIARKILAASPPVVTTRELAALVASAVPSREPGQDPATRTFQALRIHINRELDELGRVLPQCVDALRPGGRLVVISFHSLEDRIVKHFLRGQAAPDAAPPRLPVRATDLPPPRVRLLGKPVRASAAEVAANPRARSAVLRAAERTAAPGTDPKK